MGTCDVGLPFTVRCSLQDASTCSLTELLIMQSHICNQVLVALRYGCDHLCDMYKCFALKRADLGLWHGHVVHIHAAQHATGHAHSVSGCKSLPVLSQTYALQLIMKRMQPAFSIFHDLDCHDTTTGRTRLASLLGACSQGHRAFTGWAGFKTDRSSASLLAGRAL